MKRYAGEKNFRDFFKYLSEQCGEKYERSDVEFPRFVPKQYAEFMRYAEGTRFWIGSYFSFSDTARLKKSANELLEENGFAYRLKENDFVFWMHGGYMFYFFNTNEGDDPPVYYYSECDDMTEFVKCSESFTDFIISPYITGIPNP